MTNPPSTLFLVALYPGFQLLDLAGPLDILNILSLPPFNAAIGMKFIAESRDPVPVKPIAPKADRTNWVFDVQAAMNQPTVNTAFNQYFVPDVTFDEYLAAAGAPKMVDDGGLGDVMATTRTEKTILLIPGGVGARLHRIPVLHNGGGGGDSKTSDKTLNVSALLAFIKAATTQGQSNPHPISTIITVCTGSDILARTGLLDHRRATSNMMRFKETAARHPAVKWQTAARWVKSLPSETEPSSTGKNDLEIWSSAGISAGMDVTLAFVAEYFGGLEVARDIALRLEYEWREVGEGERDVFYERFYGKG